MLNTCKLIGASCRAIPCVQGDAENWHVWPSLLKGLAGLHTSARVTAYCKDFTVGSQARGRVLEVHRLSDTATRKQCTVALNSQQMELCKQLNSAVFLLSRLTFSLCPVSHWRAGVEPRGARGLSAAHGAWDNEIIKDEGHKVETMVQPKAPGEKNERSQTGGWAVSSF